MSTALVSGIAREDQVQIGQQEGVYSSALAQSMYRQESRSQAASLTEMLQDARQKAEVNREKLEQAKPAPRYGDAPLEAYARLKRAQSEAQISSAAGYARRRIVQLEAARRSDPDHADQIKAAVTQLKKAVARAGRKKLELSREQLALARMKRKNRRLEQQRTQEQQHAQQQRTRQELHRRRTARAIRESGYLRETEIANRQADQLTATRMELRRQAQQLDGSYATSVDAAVQGYSSAIQTGETVDAPVSIPQVDVQA